ncbi:MAG: ATP-dependent RNA helicase HrpA [Thermodesulfobacteriota bacterium]|nr:ATP-dependent RNA helicase HrpA [Thermodesulfobacteriota bacterium]
MKNCMRIDRFTLTRNLNFIGQMIKKGAPEETLLKRLNNLERRMIRSIEIKKERLAHLPKITYPENLPITSRKEEIIDAIRHNPVVVITGETGSGKTTQIPKMCIEAGRGIDGAIGCTQPRRIAAVTVSRRIASELNEPLGKSVGYKIRFEEEGGGNNYIKFMTDGILLMETQGDRYLNEYDTIIVDEAHERSINIDFILGILKNLLKKRSDLRVIITSATIDPEKFSRAFDNAPIIEVSGRMYPVEIIYRPLDPELEERGENTYVDGTVSAVGDLKRRSKRGNILVFMPTERDIRETCDRIAAKKYMNTAVFPLFARLSSKEQQRVFLPSKGQKIIVATNVAETSITIPGIRYVIDSGLARIAEYNPSTRTKRLPIKGISKSSALQRKGRCGRVQNGICIRLYTEEKYESRSFFTQPEILRSNLAEIILRMIDLNIGDISTFPFIDPPTPKSIKDGYNILTELEAITREKGTILLTDRGKKMARMPADPRISRMIIEAEKENCVDEVLIIASALSIQDPRERPLEAEKEADETHKPFINTSSDFMTLLTIWNKYHDSWKALKTQNRMRKFCKAHFLSYRRMTEWMDIQGQIATILKELKIGKKKRARRLEGEALFAGIHRSILSGYLSNIAVKKEKNLYQSTKGKEVMIFPGSGIFNGGNDWIVSAEVVETSRIFARTAANIKVSWLEEVGKDLCRFSYSTPHWEKGRGEVVAAEQVSLFGLVIVTERPRSFGPVNPEEASRIFIRNALVSGDVKKTPPFLIHNLELIETLQGMEDKLRKRNILAGEDEMMEFYEKHLGTVYDMKMLQDIIDERGSDEFLTMKEEDIVKHYPEDELSLYPDEIAVGDTKLDLSYRFDPGRPDDGVTVRVPAPLAPTAPLEKADWKIPGLLREKITALIKGLPKEYRKKLVPIPRTVEIIVSEMEEENQSLLFSLAQFVYKRFGVDIPAREWPVDALPDYLKTRFSIIDEKGKELNSGRDINMLRAETDRDKKTPAFKRAQSTWEKGGLTTWDFGNIPESIKIREKNGIESRAYPALEAGEGCVNLRLFKYGEEAEKSHRDGVKALYRLHFKKDLKLLKRYLALPEEMKPWANYFGGPEYLEKSLFEKTVRDLFENDTRKEEEFFLHAESVRSLILSKGQESLREIGPVLKAYHETRSLLHDMELSNRSNPTLWDFIAELRSDLVRLVPENFPMIYESERLLQIPRYLNALSMRAKRGISHLEKDRAKAKRLKSFTDSLDNLSRDVPHYSTAEKRKAINEFSWMIEEYKISLFAPEIKTLFTISPKRLDDKLREIERTI